MFKKNHLMLLMLFSAPLLFGSMEDCKDTEYKSSKRTYDHINPLPLADYIVTLNCKRINLSTTSTNNYERKVDPLKLQKLLYYAFSHIKVNFGVNLWDIERYPLVVYHYGSFSWAVHHDGYNGNYIREDQIEKAYARSNDVILNDTTRIWLNVIDRLYKGQTGITLKDKSHRELPYLRGEFQQPLALSDIDEEFEKLEHRLPFVKALFSLSEEQFNCVVPDPHRIFKKWKTKEFSALLEDDQQSPQLSPYAKRIIGQEVYPRVLVQNFDAKDNVFSRPDVIERVAIAAGFGNKRAWQHLSEIFEHYTIDQGDAYDQTAQYLQAQLSSMVENSDSAIHVPAGLEEYQQAQQQTTFEEAEKRYRSSLTKGYARSAFELAKMHFSRSDTTTGVTYLKTAFERGMLTATDMLLPYLSTEAEKIEYLKRRGDAGDPYGYYELAKYYESRSQISGKEGAISYYFKAQPFFGYTELKAIQKKHPTFMDDLNEEALDDFFKDIVQILNINALNTIWDIEE